MQRIHYLLLALMAIVGCIVMPTVLPAQQSGIRIINLSPNAPNLDFYIDDTVNTVAANVPFGSASAVTQLDAGLKRVKIAYAGTDPDTARIDSYLTLPATTRLCVLAIDSLSKLHARTLSYSLTATTNPDITYLRVVNALPNAGAVDVRITDANGSQTTFGNVTFEGVTQYLSLPKGKIEVLVFTAGSNDSLLRVGGNFSGGTYETAILTGFAPNLNVQVLHESVPLQQKPLTTLQRIGGTGRLRFVNGVEGAPAVDVFIDDNPTPVVTNIAFRDASRMLTMPAGTHNVKLSATGLPISTALFSQDYTGNADTVYTGIGIGSVSNGSVVILRHPIALPLDKDSVLVRIINGGTNTDNGDIRFTDANGIGGISALDQPWGQTTEYQKFPAGALTVELSPSGGDAIYRASGTFQGNSAVTLIVTGTLKTKDFRINALIDSDTSRQAPMLALTSIPIKGVFRAVNVATDLDSIVIYPNNETQNAFPLGAYSATPLSDDYAGTLNVKVSLPGSGIGSPIVQGDVEIEPNRLGTLFILGSKQNNTLDTVVLRLNESNVERIPDERDSAHALLRVLNAVPGSGPLNVNLAFQDGSSRQVSSLAYKEASLYMLVPEGSLSIPLSSESAYFLNDALARQTPYTLVLTPSGPRLLDDGDEQPEILRQFTATLAVPATAARSVDQIVLHPNPATGSAFVVSYILGSREHVTITLHDLLGRSVASLDEGTEEPGEQNATISTETLPVGTYNLVVSGENGRAIATGRVVVVK
jgi:hypothetical protein